MTLITRLRAASEGSRELSDSFLIALGWHRLPSQIWIDRRGHAWHFRDIPSPTESIDDALKFKPEGAGSGMNVTIRAWTDRSEARLFDAGHFDLMAGGRSPALALCIAILESRAQQKG